MRGFKINFKGEEKLIGQQSAEGSVMLIISKGCGEENFRIDLRGYEPQEDTSFEWLKEEILTQEKITIEFVSDIESEMIAEPIMKNYNDSDQFVIREKVKYYHKLKEELNSLGLI